MSRHLICMIVTLQNFINLIISLSQYDFISYNVVVQVSSSRLIRKSSLCNVAETRVKFKTSSQTDASQAAVSDQNQDDASNEEVRHRILYTKEQKLAAINYATITVKTHKDESIRSINKYVAAKDLDIISVMLRN